MKQITKALVVAIVFIAISCKEDQGKEQKKAQRVEKDLMDCTYGAFADQGASLDSLIESYEDGLISDNILNNKDGKSYIALLDRLLKEDSIRPTTSFMNQFQSIAKPDQSALAACQRGITQDTTRYNNSKYLNLEKAINAVGTSGRFDPNVIVKTTASILNEEDLEMPFYKMRVFLILDMYRMYDEMDMNGVQPN